VGFGKVGMEQVGSLLDFRSRLRKICLVDSDYNDRVRGLKACNCAGGCGYDLHSPNKEGRRSPADEGRVTQGSKIP
jgi:hypothetical protein